MRSARCIAAIAAFAVVAAAFGQPAGVDRGKLESLHEAGAAFAKTLADANATVEAVADSRQKLEHEVARFQTNPSPDEKRIVDLYAAAAQGYQDARNRFLTEKSREHFLADVKQVQAELVEADKLYQSSPAAAPAPAPPIAPLPVPPPSQRPPEETVPVQPEPTAPPVPVPPPMPPAHSPEPPTHARPPIPPPPAPPPVIPVPPPTTTAVPPPQPSPQAAPPPPAAANPPVPVPQPPPMEAPPAPPPPAVVPAAPPALPPPAPVSPPAAAAAPTPPVQTEPPPAAAPPAPPIVVPEPPSAAPAPEPVSPPSTTAAPPPTPEPAPPVAAPPPAAHRPPPIVARGELPTTPNDVRKTANKLRVETNAASVVDRCTLLGEVTTGEVRSGVYEIGGHNFLYDDALGLARLKVAEAGGNTLLVRNRTKTSVTGDAYRCGP